MKQVLVIDDSEEFRLILNKFLKAKFNCDVLLAENGNVGLELLKRFEPNLILLDIDMPVMNGIEFLTKLRSTPERSAIPVIMMTASKDRTHVESSLHLGITDYILKPFNVNTTYEKVLKVLR